MKCEMPLCNKDDNVIHITDKGKLCDRCFRWLKRQGQNLGKSTTAEKHFHGKHVPRLITGT
jgi:hypothetical protein